MPMATIGFEPRNLAMRDLGAAWFPAMMSAEPATGSRAAAPGNLLHGCIRVNAARIIRAPVLEAMLPKVPAGRNAIGGSSATSAPAPSSQARDGEIKKAIDWFSLTRITLKAKETADRIPIASLIANSLLVVVTDWPS